MTLVDLSHTVVHGMVTYPGLDAPVICDYWTRGEVSEFQIGRIDMVANTGTYVDSPFHRFEEGKDLSELPLASLAELDALVVRADGAVGAEAFAGRDVRDKAVLVHTGWSRHWGTDTYFHGHPYLTEAAAVVLRDGGAAMVGIDSLNIDDTFGTARPVHTILLGADIPVCEHLTNLDALPDDGFRFHAVPVKVKGMGTFPVRAYAVLG
jgi:arylformamidase